MLCSYSTVYAKSSESTEEKHLEEVDILKQENSDEVENHKKEKNNKIVDRSTRISRQAVNNNEVFIQSSTDELDNVSINYKSHIQDIG
ncbi:hypothetical protein [Thomasclavelia sp.]